MYRLINENENAFYKRYGYSLKKKWNQTAQVLQNKYILKMRSYITNNETGKCKFKDNAILRVVIGYIDKKILFDVLKNANPVTCIVLWEPEEGIFEAGCALEDISELINDPRLTIITGRNRDHIRNTISAVVFDNNVAHRQVETYGDYDVKGNTDVGIFYDIFDEICFEIECKMHFRKAYNEEPYKNILYAIRSVSNNNIVTQLFAAILNRDIPIIIVSAGPSLMKNCTELKKAKGRALIISVARAVVTLRKYGIEPDIVAIKDSVSPFFLEGLEEKDYRLLCSIYSNRVFQEKYNGNLIYYGFPLVGELFSSPRTSLEQNIDIDTGSVATDIFSLFLGAGFKKYILVGQDLAYSEDGLTHTEKEKEDNMRSGVLIEAEGINGNVVRVREDWELFRRYYEKKIKENCSVDLIDATEGGALIHGSKVLPLSDAIDQYCDIEYPISKWLNSMEKVDAYEKTFVDRWFEEQLILCERIENKLEYIIELAAGILSKWTKTDEWDDEFAASCKKYDVLYKMLIDGSDSALLREYCRADIERYLENAFVYEGDENIVTRIEKEKELFVKMKEKLGDMRNYILDLNSVCSLTNKSA